MIVILTKPYKIGSKTHPVGYKISIESNTAKQMIRSGKAKKPGVIYKVKKRIRKAVKKKLNK